MGKHQTILTATYGSAGAALAVLAKLGALPKAAATVLLALAWLGFLLGISFTESWVKFRSPFVPRHLALDVGRTMFGALNAAEAGLCLGLWLVYLLVGHSSSFPADDAVVRLVLVTALLAVQVIFLYPKLNLAAEYALFDELKQLPEDALSFNQKMQFGEVRHNVQVADKPGIVPHVLYVGIEVVKAALLVSYAYHFLKFLPQ